MAKRRPTTGELGWIGLVAYIIVVDSIAWVRQQGKRPDDETMSLAWGRWIQNPAGRGATGLAWALVTGHLFLSLPLPGQRTLKSVILRKRLR